MVNVAVAPKQERRADTQIRLVPFHLFPAPDLLVFGFPTHIIIYIIADGESKILIHFGIRHRANGRRVGFIIGKDQKKILTVTAFQKVDGPVGASVSKGKGLRKVPAQHEICIPGIQPFPVCQFLQVVSHIVPIFRVPAIGTFPQTEIISSVQMIFSDICSMDSFLGKPLPNGPRIIGKAGAVCPAAHGMRVLAGKNASAGRLAYRLCRIRPVISDPFPRQPVQIGRSQPGIPVAPKHIPALGVGHDENDLPTF